MKRSTPFLVILLILLGTSCAGDDQAVLVRDGAAKAAIFVAPDVMAADKDVPSTAPHPQYDLEIQRRMLRESVNDLALYLGKMSGARIEVIARAPEASDKLLPILVGDLATKEFGPMPKSSTYKQGWRVVVSPKGVGLMGESGESASYAVYELLDRLGCRWYMPSDMGEVIPEMKTIRLPPSDVSGTPETIYRGIWYADDAFRRRNRMGGLLLNAGHALEINNYITPEQFKQHPEWGAEHRGKRVTNRFCWANADAAAAVADGIIAALDKQYSPTISLSPDDGGEFCDCAKCKALDAGDFDQSLGVMSITDRYIHFCNQIAERVTKKYPDVLFGFLAYVQYTKPPVREKLHPNLIPQIAPITYCRAHTMVDSTCPSRPMIRPAVEGWGKAAKMVSYYNYMFHLAEVAPPYPMMAQMSAEIPILYANNVKLWQPETMPNFESILPGMWLTIRMSWHTNGKPSEILDEFFTRFYGAASGPMRQYWQLFDDAWTQVPEHAGCAFGYGKRFTPEFMKKARETMNAAIAACKTDAEKKRVKMQDDSLKQFELFMKMRWDLAAGRLADLEADGDRYMKTQIALGDEYAPQFAFTKVGYKPNTVTGAYFDCFYAATYKDGSRVARDFNLISETLPLRCMVDKEKKGESLGWQKPGFDDKDWKPTDPSMDTWFSMGLDTFYGPMWYRTKATIPKAAAGKKTFLWVSSTDGECRVFVNGKRIPYVVERGDEKGKVKDHGGSYCEPLSFDITSAVKPGAENQITIIGTHTFINELGTGGLIGPVMLYQEK